MKRYTGKTMNMQHFHDFYFLEAIQAGLTTAAATSPSLAFKHSFDRLENDVRVAFEELTHRMATRIYFYLWAASLGEVRHAHGMVGMYIKELTGYGMSRSTVYNKSFDFFPSDENVKTLKEVYSQNWGGAYGGQAWMNIVEGMELFGKVSDATFIDHALDLEHNGGNVFSKPCDYGLDVSDGDYSQAFLARFLDHKFRHNILDTVYKRGGVPTTLKVSRKVYGLFERFINVTDYMNIKMHVVKEFLNPSLEWLDEYTVDWDYGTFTTVGKPTDHSEMSDRREEYRDEEREEYRLSGEGVRVVEVGKRYYVRYDGYDHGCGWMPGNMKNRVVIKIEKVGYHGFGFYKGYWYTYKWLKEVKKDLRVGQRVLVCKPKNTSEFPVWVGQMEKFSGKVMKVCAINTFSESAYVEGSLHAFNKKWLKPIKKENLVGKTTRTRGDRRPSDHCVSCKSRVNEWSGVLSDIERNTYCLGCYGVKFTSCGKCGQEEYHGDIVQTENHPLYSGLCKMCASGEGKDCWECSEWYPCKLLITPEDDPDAYCPSCAKDKLCERCGKYYYNLDDHNEKRHNV